jgi:Skp family chaperone for outer membrane proteins
MWNHKLAIGTAAVGVAATLLTAAAGYGRAPDKSRDRNKEDTVSTVGFVDLDAVSAEVKKSPTWQKLFQKATETRTTFGKELDELVQRRYLTEAEKKELDELQGKAKPSDAERARISKLLMQSGQMDDEYTELANISSDKMTPKQSARLQELNRLRSEASNRLQAERAKREDKLREMETQMLSDMQTQILKVVSDVAKGQSVEVVVDRAALLYGGKDLTSQVIAKLPTK